MDGWLDGGWIWMDGWMNGLCKITSNSLNSVMSKGNYSSKRSVSYCIRCKKLPHNSQ